jgi:hypothetical protein
MKKNCPPTRSLTEIVRLAWRPLCNPLPFGRRRGCYPLVVRLTWTIGQELTRRLRGLCPFRSDCAHSPARPTRTVIKRWPNMRRRVRILPNEIYPICAIGMAEAFDFVALDGRCGRASYYQFDGKFGALLGFFPIKPSQYVLRAATTDFRGGNAHSGQARGQVG